MANIGETNLVLEMANALKEAFTQARRAYDSRVTKKPSQWGSKSYPRWDGGQADDGRYYKSVWISVATECINRGYDVRVLVRVLFEDSKLTMAPVPTMLMSTRNIERYVKSKDSQVSELQDLKSTQDIAFRDAFIANNAIYRNKAIAANAAINDTTQPLSAMYRCCVAAVANDTETYERFEQQAVLEYAARQRTYNDAWGKFIPAAMKRAAKQLISKVQDYASDTETAGRTSGHRRQPD